ncbi:MAG: hypothetical protein ACK4HQ_09655, partial [Brevinematales bacterium]
MRLSSRLSWNIENNKWAEILAHHTIFYDLTISNPTKAFDLSQYEKTIVNALSQPEAISYEPSPLGLKSAREFLAEA